MSTVYGRIYIIKSDLNDVPQVYIGQTTRSLSSRFKQHCSASSMCKSIHNAIETYGKDHFHIEQLAQAATRQQLNQLQKHYIQKYKSNIVGFNRNSGGAGNTMSEAIRLQMRKTNYRNRSVTCLQTGVTYISGSQAARQLGLCYTDVNQCCSMHLAQVKGLHFYYTDLGTQSYHKLWSSCKRNRNVTCITTGIVYRNVNEAARQTGTTKYIVRRACQKHTKKPYKTDLVFRYTDSLTSE